MYRRPKSLEIILDIRAAMSEEAGFDVSTFVEAVRTGVAPSDKTRTVTREEGGQCDELHSENITDTPKIGVSDQ